MPAEPQQISPSPTSRTSRPGTAARTCRGWARTPWAWARWQASCQATFSGSGRRSAVGPSSASSSDRSRTLAENAAARSAQAGSSRSRWPYSFMAAPQPAALTTTSSTPAASKVAMASLANACASASRPACRLSAPQQPWPAGATTSQPSAPARVREEPEDQRPEGAVATRARVAALDLVAGGLDQLVVLDPRRAGGHARHAAEAPVEVADHLVVHGLALEPDLHQVDAAPRRVHLLAPQQVGRAGRQAEAAVDAVVDQPLVRRVVQVERRYLLGHLRCLPRSGRGSAAGRGRTAA